MSFGGTHSVQGQGYFGGSYIRGTYYVNLVKYSICIVGEPQYLNIKFLGSTVFVYLAKYNICISGKVQYLRETEIISIVLCCLWSVHAYLSHGFQIVNLTKYYVG